MIQYEPQVYDIAVKIAKETLRRGRVKSGFYKTIISTRKDGPGAERKRVIFSKELQCPYCRKKFDRRDMLFFPVRYYLKSKGKEQNREKAICVECNQRLQKVETK